MIAFLDYMFSKYIGIENHQIVSRKKINLFALAINL
jgi:hypothetical protein